MKFKIGNLEVQTKAGFGDPTFTRLLTRQPKLVGRKPRHVYNWDCSLVPGKNAARPRYLVVEPSLTIAVLTATGGVNRAATNQKGQRLLQASGAANTAALDRMIAANFKPSLIEIPWAGLSAYFTRRYSVTVLAWVDYKDMVLTPTAGPVQDSYILSYPSAVRFVAVVTYYCGLFAKGAPGFLIPTPDKVKTVRVRPASGTPTDFIDEFDREVRDKFQNDPTGSRALGRRLRTLSDRQQGRYHDRIRAEDPDDW